ncbi:MAG: PEGA domain-containing protein, partial [Treponema sp.]|nr:PEGA domain-containing protein [Treponema sp.]
MFGKNRPPEETLPEDQVKLKPLLGIRPGVYLAWLYGFIILGILFFVFLYPGLAYPGSLLSLSSAPRGAAVRVDGVYRGTAPGDFFVPRGKHKIEMILPGFEPFQTETDLGSRLFASRFFPLRKSIHGELGLTRPAEVFSGAAADYAAWSFAGEPTATYQIPLSLSEGAYQAGPAVAGSAQA